MKQSRRLLTLLLTLALCFGIASCSDVQNRKKSENKEVKTKNGSISLKVLNRSTTKGTETTEGIPDDVEEKITKTLTKVLISGARETKAFSKDASSDASSSFKDNKEAKKNTAEVSYSFLDANPETDSVIVAELAQNITNKDDVGSKKLGVICFDTSGVIIGFDFNDSDEFSTKKTEVTS